MASFGEVSIHIRNDGPLFYNQAFNKPMRLCYFFKAPALLYFSYMLSVLQIFI